MNPITPQNISRHELIGLKVKVSRAANRQLTGLSGTVVDETRNTLKLSDGAKKTIIPKEIATFDFHLPTQEIVRVEGKMLVGRAEDRIKMRMKGCR